MRLLVADKARQKLRECNSHGGDFITKPNHAILLHSSLHPFILTVSDIDRIICTEHEYLTISIFFASATKGFPLERKSFLCLRHFNFQSRKTFHLQQRRLQCSTLLHPTPCGPLSLLHLLLLVSSHRTEQCGIDTPTTTAPPCPAPPPLTTAALTMVSVRLPYTRSLRHRTTHSHQLMICRVQRTLPCIHRLDTCTLHYRTTHSVQLVCMILICH